MPVLAKSRGIVMRTLIDRTFGRHFHAIYGDSELVIALNPMRVLQGDVPAWVRAWALDWVKAHQGDFRPVSSDRPGPDVAWALDRREAASCLRWTSAA